MQSAHEVLSQTKTSLTSLPCPLTGLSTPVSKKPFLIVTIFCSQLLPPLSGEGSSCLEQNKDRLCSETCG